jgi:YaiO family outer membrane protein
VDIRQQTASRRSWSAGIRETTRFSLHDDAIAGGLYQPLSRRSGALFEVELSPSHNVVPRLALAGRVDAGIGRGWVLNGGLRHRRYDAAVVELTELGIERYAGVYRFVYTAFLGHLRGGGTAASQSVRMDRLYGRDQSSLFGISFSGGSELERVAASGILRTNVRAVSITGRHWVTPRWAIVYAAGLHEQGDLYARRGGTAGLISRF